MKMKKIKLQGGGGTRPKFAYVDRTLTTVDIYP